METQTTQSTTTEVAPVATTTTQTEGEVPAGAPVVAEAVEVAADAPAAVEPLEVSPVTAVVAVLLLGLLAVTVVKLRSRS